MTIPKQNRPRDKGHAPCKMEQMSWYRIKRVLQAGTKDEKGKSSESTMTRLVLIGFGVLITILLILS